jgi:hypothetical protein
MLGDRLTGHLQPLAQLAERLTIPVVQPIQQLPTVGVGQGAKHNVLIHEVNREPNGYLIR